MSKHEPGQSEWLTRKSLIDANLKGSGWTVVPFDLFASPIRDGHCAITAKQMQLSRQGKKLPEEERLRFISAIVFSSTFSLMSLDKY